MAERPRLRAVVLAAGEGRRLRPLTLRTPKPLLPVLGRPILEHTLDQLRAIDCEGVAINLHHLGDQIEKRFGFRYRGMPLHYSHEERLLGTSGALVPIRDFLSAADLVLVINGDSFCRWPLKRVLRRHRKRRPAVTLLVTRSADPRRFGGGVGIDRHDLIVSFQPEESFGAVKRRRVFAGLHVLEPDVLARLPAGSSDFIDDLYLPLLAAGKEILAVSSRRPWEDLGTPRRYLDGVLRAVAGRGPRRLTGRTSWVSPATRVDRSARVGPAVVERGVTIGAGAEVKRCLLLPGSGVGRGARISDCIVGFDVEVPADTQVARRMITRRRAGQAVPEGSSVLGGLVFTPLA
jgi:NDP-sugar pyrophosphorylase family protein